MTLQTGGRFTAENHRRRLTLRWKTLRRTHNMTLGWSKNAWLESERITVARKNFQELSPESQGGDFIWEGRPQSHRLSPRNGGMTLTLWGGHSLFGVASQPGLWEKTGTTAQDSECGRGQGVCEKTGSAGKDRECGRRQRVQENTGSVGDDRECRKIQGLWETTESAGKYRECGRRQRVQES